MPIEKKRGKLSNEDVAYINEYHNTKSVDDIALVLNRTPETIQAFMERTNLLSNADSPDIFQRTVLKNKLLSRSYFHEAKKQFTQDELDYFQEHWIELQLQFKEDVLYSEELVIKDWLTLDILMGRALKDRRDSELALESVKKEYDDEFKKGDGVRNPEILGQLEIRRGGLESAIESHTQNHMNLLKEVKNLIKSLKGNRDERIQRIEDGKTHFTGLLRALQDPVFRAEVAEEIELVKISKNKTLRELSRLHQYGDGNYDKPFLTPETVFDDDEETNEKIVEDLTNG